MKITVKGKEYDLEELHITGNCSEEREVTVTTTADEDIIHVYTSDDVYLTRLKKLITANPDSWKITNLAFMKDGTLSGVMVIGPKNGLSFRAATEREYTDEQRASMVERGKAVGSLNKKSC